MTTIPSDRPAAKNSSRIAPLPALSLRQMLYFVTLAYSRSFTETASQLSVTQPALSAAIRQMEKQFGGALFDRSSHRVTLTEAGAAILPLAEHLLNTARSAFTDMASSFTTQAHTVRVGLIPSAATRLLPTLAAIRQAHIPLRIELIDLPNSDLLNAIERGEVDFGIGVAPTGKTSFEHHTLWEDEMVLLLPADDPLSSHATVPWQLLAGREIAVFQRGSVSDLVSATIAAHGLILEPAYRIEHTEPLYGLVRAGLALAILPRLYTETLYDPALVTRSLVKPRVARSIALMRTHHAPRSPTVAQCFSALHAALLQVA